MKRRLRLSGLVLLAFVLLTYALFVAPSSNPIGRAASPILRSLRRRMPPDPGEPLFPDNRRVFGVPIWTRDEGGGGASLDSFLYELGRSLPDHLKSRWSEAVSGKLPYAPDADTLLVPAPLLKRACEMLGPEALDQWVLLTEAETPESMRALGGRLDLRGIEWRAFGADVCVRRRDRAGAREALGFAIWTDAYICPCFIRIRTEEPSRYAGMLRELLNREDLRGFVTTENGGEGTYELTPFVRWRSLGTDQAAFDLIDRITSRLGGLGAETDVKRAFP